MNQNHVAVKLIDTSKRFLKCRDDYQTEEEFQLVLDLGMYLREHWLWNGLLVSDKLVEIKEYKKLIIKISRINVDNPDIYHDKNGKEIKQIIARLAEIWSKPKKTKSK